MQNIKNCNKTSNNNESVKIEDSKCNQTNLKKLANYDSLFKQFDLYSIKGYNLLNFRKEIDAMPNSANKIKALEKFEMIKIFLQSFKK